MASSHGSPDIAGGASWSRMTSPVDTPEDDSQSRSNSPDGNGDTSMMEGDGSGRGKRKSRVSGANTAAPSGAFQTVGKIRHLKKEDGEPLWRRDIQYDFLREVFGNEDKHFTNSYDLQSADKQSFADLYIDTMARSSKTSKVLRDKLLSDREAAKGMAMVCLLVNVGRMNTTLNFFPEMRAQLRTYHAIPSLQAHADATAYKQLQDAPRLKSILKGAAEDRNNEPRDLTEFKDMKAPRSNPVNLIFLICNQASNIAELHFPSGHEFHDLIMKTNYTSKSRAQAFLWLMWQYLESDFTEEGCEENPFGAGVDYELGLANQGIPRMVEMTPEQEALENIDTPEEIEFGHQRQEHRAKLIAADQYMVDHQTKRGPRAKLIEDSPSAAILPRIRPSKHESDMDSTRSTPPPRALSRLGAISTGRRGGASLKYQILESSPAPGAHGIEGIVPRKPRPPTAHQLAVERSRNQRVTHILDRGLRRSHHEYRKVRRREGILSRTKRRLDAMTDGEAFADSDDDDMKAYAKNNKSQFRDHGLGGLCQLKDEDDNFGEEPMSFAAGLRRASRRLERWHTQSAQGVVAPVKRRQTVKIVDDSFAEMPIDLDSFDGSPDKLAATLPLKHRQPRVNGDAHVSNGDVTMEDADALDDVDKELLGLESDGEEREGKGEAELETEDKDEDDALDGIDKTLLGLDDDEDTENS
ncbi:hypothetical protein GGR57DRAFT_462021 [Xylariaceae sp. FL1272]|nr:hypothetical protein GGR57DRAFT_462021 [Xylariaceae sp. FL1272]